MSKVVPYDMVRLYITMLKYNKKINKGPPYYKYIKVGNIVFCAIFLDGYGWQYIEMPE